MHRGIVRGLGKAALLCRRVGVVNNNNNAAPPPHTPSYSPRSITVPPYSIATCRNVFERNVFTMTMRTRNGLDSFIRHSRRSYSTENSNSNPNQVRLERRKEEEALRNAVPGSLRWFALKFNPIYRKLYVVDSTPTLSMWLLLIPALIMALLYLYADLQQDAMFLEWLNRHFRCSLQNLEEGRYHTILTSILAPAADGAAPFFVSTLVPMIGFAGNLMRNIGVGPVVAAMLVGHLSLTAVLLGFNYLQYKGIQHLQDALDDGQDLYNKSSESSGGMSADMKAEKRKLVFALAREAGSVNISALEKQQYKILSLPDNQFLDMASARYYQRETAAVGAGVSLAAIAARLHPLGMLAVPFAPLPVLAVFVAQAGFTVASVKTYAVPELAGSLGGAVFLPFIGMHATRSALGELRFKEMPEKILQKLGLSDWTIRARNPELYAPSTPTSPGDSLSKIFQAGVQLTKEQVEMMRKRNEKFQRKAAPQGTKIVKNTTNDDVTTPKV
jgi:hypothetical protein